MRRLRGSNAGTVISSLNPVIRGGRLSPQPGIHQHVLRARALHVAAHLEVGDVEPPEQGKALDRREVLRQVLPDQGRRMGLRQPGHRRLPAAAQLDRHPEAHHGQGPVVPRRPGPDRILGEPEAEERPRARRGHPDPAHQAGTPVPGTAATRSSTSTICPPHPRNGKTGGTASPARTSPAQPARREPRANRKERDRPHPHARILPPLPNDGTQDHSVVPRGPRACSSRAAGKPARPGF